MHTVFINTSRAQFSGRMDVLWMEREYKQYIAIDSPLSAACGARQGFASCALRIGEQIDIHKDINNDFNLVLYADYLEFEEYLRPLFPDYDTDYAIENTVYEVTQAALTHLLATALYQQLEEKRRLPREKMLLLLEQRQRRRVDEKDYFTEDTRTRKMDLRIGVLCRLLGLPTEQEMKVMADSAADGAALAEALCRRAQENRVVTNGVDWQGVYAAQLETFFAEIATNKDGVSNACIGLEKAIAHLYLTDTANTLLVSPFITDRRSLGTNKALDTQRILLLQMFLWDCIQSRSIYAPGCRDGMRPKTVPVFGEEDWRQLVTLFDAKKRGLEAKEQEVGGIRVEYQALGLAPPLYTLPGDKFGLDESGNLRKKVSVKITPPKKKEKKKKDEAEPNQEDNGPQSLIDRETVELEEVEDRKQNWFEGKYEPMDVEGEAYTDDVHGLLSAAEYCARARDLAEHHMNFMNLLCQKVGRVTSNYAGRSLTNTPALLRKRTVSANDALQDAGVNDYMYTDGARQDETDVADNVIRRAKQSYLTMLLEYLKFNAARGVAMTTIKEQCEHFIARVRAIEASLKVLYIILLVMVAFVTVAYTPFLLIQWELITKNINTLLYALLSLAAPYLLLAVGYVLATVWQKRKMQKAWEELLETSRRAAEENKQAVRAYEALLTKHIPSLRWIYEYVLDVEFFRDCNRIASAKLQHHRNRLAMAAEVLGNLIEDLEYEPLRRNGPVPELDIDYSQAFCEGRNQKVYAIIDDEVEKWIRKGRST